MTAKTAKSGVKRTVYKSDFVWEPVSQTELGRVPTEFVQCRICSTDMAPLNFEWPMVATDVTLGAIKTAIMQRHRGAILDIVLFKDHVHPDFSLFTRDDGSSLKDIGVKGVPAGHHVNELPVVTLFYDFPAINATDPLLTCSPGNVKSKHNISLKQYLTVQKQHERRS